MRSNPRSLAPSPCAAALTVLAGTAFVLAPVAEAAMQVHAGGSSIGGYDAEIMGAGSVQGDVWGGEQTPSILDDTATRHHEPVLRTSTAPAPAPDQPRRRVSDRWWALWWGWVSFWNFLPR